METPTKPIRSSAEIIAEASKLLAELHIMVANSNKIAEDIKNIQLKLAA